MSDIVYRELKAQEEMQASAFLQSNDEGFSYLALLDLDQDHVFTLGAFEKDVIVGLLQASCVEEDADIVTVAVSSTHRRQGVAKAMWGNFLNIKTNIEIVILEVSIKNFPAIAFYETLGFLEQGVRKNYYKDLKTQEITDACVMVYNKSDELVGEIVF